MRRSTQGFSAVMSLALILILAVVSFAGWRVWERRHRMSSITNFEQCAAAGNPVMESFPERCSANGHTYTNTKQSTQTQPPKPVTNDSACQIGKDKKGKLLSLGDDTFSFCQPNGWKLFHTEVPGAFFAAYTNLQYNQAAAPTVEQVGGSDNAYEFYVFNKAETEYVSQNYTKQTSLQTTTGLKLEVYYHLTTQDDPVGAGLDSLAAGTKQYVYLVAKNNGRLQFSYHVVPGQTDQSDLVLDVVRTTR